MQYMYIRYEILTQVGVAVCWDYLIQKVFSIMETTREQYFSKHLWHTEIFFFF